MNKSEIGTGMANLSQLSLLLVLLLAACGSSPGAAAPLAKISPARIKALVQSTDILDNEYKQQVYAAFADNVVSVSLFRHPEATKADCKIDAVLLARKIIDLDPPHVKLVRCVFYDYDRQNEYWEIEVRAQLVKAFGSGQIGEAELINSILLKEDKQQNALGARFASLTYSGIIDHDSVCKGSLEDKRLAIHLRLEELERQKIPLQNFREEFLRVEDAARRGKDEDLAERIAFLNKTLDNYVAEMVNSGQLQKPTLSLSKRFSGGETKSVRQPAAGTNQK